MLLDKSICFSLHSAFKGNNQKQQNNENYTDDCFEITNSVIDSKKPNYYEIDGLHNVLFKSSFYTFSNTVAIP